MSPNKEKRPITPRVISNKKATSPVKAVINRARAINPVRAATSVKVVISVKADISSARVVTNRARAATSPVTSSPRL